MKILGKIISCLVAAALYTGCITTVSASTIYGDVNNDGLVDIVDVSQLSMYLSGCVRPSRINARYADVDQNAVIDVNDLKTLEAYISHGITSLPYSENSNSNYGCTSYVFPGDSTRQYIKYNCSTGHETVYTLNQLPIVSMMSDNVDDRTIDSSSTSKSIVYLEGTNNRNERFCGSGFIVNNHIIATCAHCLYNGYSFNTDMEIRIMNETGNVLLRTVTPKELHVPFEYVASSPYEYDYGLIYVEDNLASYGKLAFGTVTDYSINTNSELDISGFPTEVMGTTIYTTRYFGTGNVKSSSNDYLLETTAYSGGGDSGGPMYIPYTLNGQTFRSVVGIVSYAQPNTAVRYSGGVRVTTPVLRFYMDNSNIGI